jgi:hypothetical protein
MAYFKCDCGKEQRKIVPIDKTNMKQDKHGRWSLDLTAPRQEPVKHTVLCDCGQTVTQTEDPDAVPSFLQINWLES